MTDFWPWAVPIYIGSLFVGFLVIRALQIGVYILGSLICGNSHIRTADVGPQSIQIGPTFGHLEPRGFAPASMGTLAERSCMAEDTGVTLLLS